MTVRDPLLGAQLGDFEVVSPLGNGGMGAVYRARDLALGREVALKVLLPQYAEDQRARERFQREIDHAVAIEHPHVVPIYAAGYERPHFYIAMRLVPGDDVAGVLRASGPLHESRAIRIVGQVASALHAVHAKGLIHRDVKPHNVLLWGAETSEEHAMLTDFGIAKALHGDRDLTGIGAAIGTPAYMAPEVCLGQVATPASDQYSLGCMAYEMLTGRTPFDGDAASLREAHVEEAPVPISRVVPALSSDFALAVDRALAKAPNERHSDLRNMVRASDASARAFARSQELTRVMQLDKAETVGRLSTEHDMSDATISQLMDIDRTEVVRLRRRQARSALVGRRKD